MAYLSGYEYYENSGNSPEDKNWGSYQYVPLKDVVNNFMLFYTGNQEIIGKVARSKAVFHAKQIIKQLNMNAFDETKALMLNLCDTLRFVMPPDYIDYLRISVFRNGVLLPLTENVQRLSAKAYLQANDCKILFDQDGHILEPEYSELDLSRIKGTKKSIYLNNGSPLNGLEGYFYDGEWYFDYTIGGRYGLNTETANRNPTFEIDRESGVINFESTLSNELVLVEYIHDGMKGGDESKIGVHKFFEEYIYNELSKRILKTRLNVQEYLYRRFKKDARAEYRNAKNSISNIKPSRLLMSLRGRDKWIK